MASRLTNSLLRRIARASAAAPGTILAAAVASVLVSLWVTATRLEFRGSQEDIGRASGVAHTARYVAHAREFPEGDAVVVVVDGRDRGRAEAFAEALAARLRRTFQGRVFYRVDPGFAAGRALLYAPPAALEALHGALAAGGPLAAAVGERPGLVPLVEALNGAVERGSGAGGPAVDPGALGRAAEGLATVVEGGQAPSLGLPVEDLSRPRYLYSDNGRFLFVMVTPARIDGGPVPYFDDRAREDALAREPVPAVRAAVDAVRAQLPGLDAGVTGPAAIEFDERESTRHDVALAVTLSFAANVVILLLSSRSVLRAAARSLCLAVGLAWSFAFLTLAIGHLNMLSAVFASIVIGVGDNFPIHLLARYEEAEREGKSRREALEVMMVNTGGPVAASALVLIAASLALVVADLPAVVELGVISAAGLALTLLAAYVVFPAMVAVIGARTAAPAPRAGRRLAERAGRAKGLFAAGLGLALAGGVAALLWPPDFDSNLLALQAQESESVRYERLLGREGAGVTQFVVTDAGSVEEARRKATALEALPAVARVESLAEVIPADQAEKRAVIERIAALAGRVGVRPEREAPFVLDPFRRGVARLAAALETAPAPEVAGAAVPLRRLLAAIDRAGPAVASARLAAAQRGWLEQTASALRLVRENDGAKPIRVEDLPEGLRDELTGRTGRLLLRIYPEGDIWAREDLARFLGAVRAVEPAVTGARVLAFEVTEAIWNAYAEAALLALALVALAAFVVYRRALDVSLALLPLAVGGLWTAGAMVLFGIDFNVANLFGVPLIIGVAVDGGMNMVGRAREEPERAGSILDLAVGKSVLIAALTTIAAFGALVFAEHRGIASLGVLLTLGATLTSLAAYVALPPALGWLATRDRPRR